MADYKRIVLDASVPRTNTAVEFGKIYNSFYFLKNDVEVEYKVNRLEADTLYVSELQGFEREGGAERLYITHPAGTAGQKIVIFVKR